MKVLAIMLCFIFFGITAAAPLPFDKGPHRNLKVLPKSISDGQLDQIMHEFNDALGVKCNFCHAPDKDSATHHLDFASDEKEEKQTARWMVGMTAKINNKYLNKAKKEGNEPEGKVSCMTCHRGAAKTVRK